MPKYKMLINARDFDQLRVAIINEKGLLEQVEFESLSNNNNLGYIYKARITAIEPSLQATFVDYGGNRHGFLPFNEIHPRYFSSQDRRAPAYEKLKIGQEIIGQIGREEIGLKGAYMTTFLSLPGQYLVMMPLTNKVGISRKIEAADDRQNLRQILEQITVPDGMGYIIRTAGLGKSREQIQRDLNILTSTWKELELRSQHQECPSVLYREDDAVSRTIRDYFNENVTELLVDEPGVFESISNYFKKVLPNYANIIKLHKGKPPLFSKYNLENQIEKVFSRKIQLPSGGSIVIEQTEALVVIDVNSGKTAEGNLEQTAFKANMEAAEEIARQLRLRDLGGLIVIDFIDLKDKRNSHEVENRLRDSLKPDKARITISGLSRFGLLEMSRQRINTSKENRHTTECVVCEGMGRHKSPDFQALELLRKIKNQVEVGTVKELRVSCSEHLASHILNERRNDLIDLEREFHCTVKIHGKPGYGNPIHYDTVRRPVEEEKEEMVMPAPLSLSSMAATMSEKDINQQKDYRGEKLDALEKATFEELRTMDIPIPSTLSPFDRFNFSVRISLMKRHGLYESLMEDFKNAIREKMTSNQTFRPGNGPAVSDEDQEDYDESEVAAGYDDEDEV